MYEASEYDLTQQLDITELWINGRHYQIGDVFYAASYTDKFLVEISGFLPHNFFLVIKLASASFSPIKNRKTYKTSSLYPVKLKQLVEKRMLLDEVIKKINKEPKNGE